MEKKERRKKIERGNRSVYTQRRLFFSLALVCVCVLGGSVWNGHLWSNTTVIEVRKIDELLINEV